MSKWIPNSESPKESGFYLVSTKNKVVYIARYDVRYGTWGSGFRNCVEAWMPLPEAYKGVEE